MKITVFTSNQPRHLTLLDRLSDIGQVHSVMECTTVFPGEVADFYGSSSSFREYFAKVIAAEAHYFGEVRFLPSEVRSIVIKSGDLNRLTKVALEPALDADVFVVFGASFIKGWLIDYLVERQAVNLHMGLSPYYRGSSCNFWALQDGNPAMVGATIHLLSRGLDSGPIIRHAVPTFVGEQPMQFTMKAVVAGIETVVETLKNGDWRTMHHADQDRSLEVRYSRNADFTDQVAADFLAGSMDARQLELMMRTSKQPSLVNPYWV